MSDAPLMGEINFYIQQDQDGYPPCAWECVWAEELSEHQYRIANIPFYAKGVSVDDLVLASYALDFGVVYIRTLKESGNSTIRICLYEECETANVLNQLSLFGCEYHLGISAELIAVNVPASISLTSLVEYLDAQSQAKIFEYEVSANRCLSSCLVSDRGHWSRAEQP